MQRFILRAVVVVMVGSLIMSSLRSGFAQPGGAPVVPPKPPVKKPLPPAPLPYKTLAENVSYAIGYNMGRKILFGLERQGLKIDNKKLGEAISISKETIADMKTQGLEIQQPLLEKGFQSGLGNGKSLLTDMQIQSVFTDITKLLQKKAEDKQKALIAKNKKEGEDFLAKNKKQPGIITTKSGLQYKIILAGKGKTPKATDGVKVHYRGTLVDGKTEFDSSIKRGQPITFQVKGVIPGWTEALQLMKVGAKWRLFIPTNLAYGLEGPPRYPNSPPSLIGPNAMLIFDIELLAITPAVKAPLLPGGGK